MNGDYHLKVHLHEIFLYQVVWPQEPTEFLINNLKYFYFRFDFCKDIQIKGTFTYSGNMQFHFAYSQVMYSFIPCIFSLH